ncbi:SH3 domain-containing protein [Telmatospirillum sp.]|uniref:SH3 domain-containing protein n=1 Tax=Telmatospirillum sp. TaxID=2079197 RepID=UPI0028411C4E|nr:SH3 domain-containing protein [Telmatospirillum sp.]MDR3435556.1 SH3 domain-containing protein [Telmatospirillum sp.]
MFSRSSVLMAGAIVALASFTTVASAADGIATRDGTLRAGPGTSYPEVATVSSGESLQIYGCVAGYGWCDVSAEGDRGWIRGSRIAFLRDGTHYRVSESYSDFGLTIAIFGLNDYWGNYYSERPWFTDHRWRRGHNALPSNWQNNRPTWVHPNPVAGNQPHRAGVTQPVGQSLPGATTHPTNTGTPPPVVPGHPRHTAPAGTVHPNAAPNTPVLNTPHVNAPIHQTAPHVNAPVHQNAPHVNTPRPQVAPHVNQPQHQAPHNQPAPRAHAPQPKLIAPPAQTCQPPAKC